MKIKRFEAENMSEALRMVKKEFGEDAVILSAKNLKKSSRIFGGSQSAQVVVTAAMDTHESSNCAASIEARSRHAFENGLPCDNRQSDSYFATQKEGLLQRFAPITRTGQQKLREKFMQMKPQQQHPVSEPASACRTFENNLIEQGVMCELAADLTRKVFDLLPSNATNTQIRTAFAQVLAVMGLVAPMRLFGRSQARIIVLVGAQGAGKTTTAAKLAARAVLQKGQTAALLSLDNQRIAGMAELESYARIMGLQLERADRPEQVGPALNRIKSADVIIVDTPGIGAAEHQRRDHLISMLEPLEGARVLLLLSAECSQHVLSKMVDFFNPIGLDSCIYTRLDWTDRCGHLINHLVQYELPVAYLGSGQQVHEGIPAATGKELADLLWEPAPTEPSEYEDENPGNDAIDPHLCEQGHYFIANRNSDIFHNMTCQSVKRISHVNTLVFKDAQEAMQQEFKPCRMCCSDLIILKNVKRPAQYNCAGNRC